MYGVPYDVFWHLNPTKLKPFKEAYAKRLKLEEYARWRNGLYVMRAVSACFGGEYPEEPFGLEPQEKAQNDNTEDEENYTEEEIIRAREALVMSLSIMEGRNKRAKAREERRKLREQQEQESSSE